MVFNMWSSSVATYVVDEASESRGEFAKVEIVVGKRYSIPGLL